MRAPHRIIPAAMTLAALTVLGWTIFGEPSPRESPSKVTGLTLPEAPDPIQEAADPLMAPALAEDSPGIEPGGRSGADTTPFVERLRPFEGEALLQVKGAPLPSPVRSGSFQLEILTQGASQLTEVKVGSGRFKLEIPDRSRVKLLGGMFNGQRVRFEGLGHAFTPVDSPYVLVGSPFPLNRLIVRDGPTGAHLSGLRVTQASGMSPLTLRDQAAGEELVLKDASSPVDLPWIESRTPLWLRVEADGYAPATAWVDPDQERTRELLLWPAAELEVRVIGDAREALKMIALFHDAPEGRTIAGGVIERRAAGVTSDGEAWVFDLVGLPALPTQVVAKGIDLKAQPVDLSTANITLEPGGRQTVVLRLRR